MTTTTQLATLPPVERAIVALSFETVKAEVSKLATQYADITAISNKAGRDQAHAAAMTLKNSRVEIQRRAKEVREDAVAFQKAVIAKGDELAALIEPEEQRLLKLRDAWDAEQERIKREAAEAEQRRKQGHEAKIADIRAAAIAKPMRNLMDLLASGEAYEIGGQVVMRMPEIDKAFAERAEWVEVAPAVEGWIDCWKRLAPDLPSYNLGVMAKRLREDKPLTVRLIEQARAEFDAHVARLVDIPDEQIRSAITTTQLAWEFEKINMEKAA